MHKKNVGILLLFSIILLIPPINSGFAQVEETDDLEETIQEIIDNPLEKSGFDLAGVYLWVPSEMVKDENYEGLVVVKNAENFDRTVILTSSDNTIVKIPQSITISAHANHGVFSITALKDGETTVFASIDGVLTESGVNIHSSSKRPDSLEIILPTNKTRTDKVVGYVVSTDKNGSPIPVEEDTNVFLSASSLIDVPEFVTIEAGSHLSKFLADVHGTGKIHASSRNMNIAETEISKGLDEIDVKVAAAPDIAMEHSRAFVYVWLEKNGLPYKPPFVTHVFLSSSNTDSVRFSENTNIQHFGDSVHKIPLINGIGKTQVITSEVGIATISASINEFGSADTTMTVGSILVNSLDEETDDDEENIDSEIGDDEESLFPDFVDDGGISLVAERDQDRIDDAFFQPNVARIWFYPDKTDDVAYGVVALYNMEIERQISTDVGLNQTSIEVTSDVTTIIPYPLDGRIVSLSASSEGLQLPNIVTLIQSNEIAQTRGYGSSHAVEFEVFVNQEGEYTLSSSGPGLNRSTSELVVTSADDENFSLNITPLPTLPGERQELAIVTIIDEEGFMVDLERNFDESIKVEVSTAGIKDISESVTIGSTNYGIIVGTPEKAGSVGGSAARITPMQTEMRLAGVAESIEFDVPSTAHLSERIPFAIHEVDAYGTPLKKISPTGATSTNGISFDSDSFVSTLEGLGKVSVLSYAGGDEKEIDIFANHMTLDYTGDFGNAIRVGEDILVDLITNVEDPEVMVSTLIPYEQISPTQYEFKPDKAGEFDITFTAYKDGYSGASATINVRSEKIVEVTIDSTTSDGSRLNLQIPFTLGIVEDIVTVPYTTEFEPQVAVLEFENKVNVGSKGYKLSSLIVNGEERKGNVIEEYVSHDLDIVVNYERQVLVKVENGKGTGVVDYGDMVTINAPPKEKLWVLIRDVFDRWEGIDSTSETVTFEAIEDITVKAIYREDPTILMLLMGGATTAGIYVLVFRKKGFNPMWYVQKLLSTFSTKKTSGVDSKPTKKKSKESKSFISMFVGLFDVDSLSKKLGSKKKKSSRVPKPGEEKTASNDADVDF